MRRFRDRDEAGRLLGSLLADDLGGITDGIVLGLPRGGVPVAARVAEQLGLPLDVFIVRKLGLPGHPEYAMGAIASGGVVVLDEGVVRRFGVTPVAVEEVKSREAAELVRRERLYRGGRDAVELAERDVILVDDGVATGSSMRAAIEAIQVYGPRSLTVAVPVAPRSAERELGPLVDAFFVLSTPSPFQAVGWWYQDFSQTTDDEVRAEFES